MSATVERYFPEFMAFYFPAAHAQIDWTRGYPKSPQARFDAKWTLIKLLFNRGWTKQRIIDLVFVIDWMMAARPRKKTAIAEYSATRTGEDDGLRIKL